jgi:nucleoside-diphosphate-sugar epimerase
LRHPRLLIVGCGDVGLRLLRRLAPRISAGRLSVVATTRDPERRRAARALGARTLAVDLDRHASALASAQDRLGALAQQVVYLAPPPATGTGDPRIDRLLAARGRAVALASRLPGLLENRAAGRCSASPHPGSGRWVLVSTTGVYGDCRGALVDESRPPAPANARARRRLAAERQVRNALRKSGLHATILRVPGLYGHDRLPVERLQRGLPIPVPADDPWVNLIHAHDLASVAWLALHRGLPGRTVNVVDDSQLKMGEWLTQVADACHLPRPPRLARAELGGRLSPAMLTFLDESRRLSNRRLKRELRARLRWPTVAPVLAEITAGQSLAPDRPLI